MNNKNCAFCDNQEIQDRIIIKNKFIKVFPTNMPIVPGHILITPIRCIAKFDELTKEEINALQEIISKLKSVFIEIFGAYGFNYAWNEGEKAGQSIPHFHLHMVPRKESDEGIVDYEPRKFLYRPGERETSPQEELIGISKIIAKKL